MKNKELKQLQEGFANASKMIGQMIELKKLKIEELTLMQKPLPIKWPMGALIPTKEKIVWHPLAGNVDLEEIKRIGEALPKEWMNKSALIAEIGTMFLEWADKYFEDKKNMNIEYRPMILNFNSNNRICLTDLMFKKKLKNYCLLKGYEFNPGLTDKNGRIFFFIKDRLCEFIFIKDTPAKPQFPEDRETKHQEG
ncbi:hypothetical protein [Chryseobacterium sp. MP_3.2]|uniref:hypothetical protein n=1 Tax=Chryseobacterium sp. MP_3.2 TaxID=3071712 RepID=UPI002DFD44E7|nr:hypothetical protein [Chryseobacterium sp. MP_3.2]